MSACMDFHPKLEQPAMVNIYARVSSRVPFLYLRNKQPNLNGRLTSFSLLGLSHSSSGTKVILPWWCNCNYIMGTRCCELNAPQCNLARGFAKTLLKCRSFQFANLSCRDLWDPIVLLWNSFTPARFWQSQRPKLHYITVMIHPYFNPLAT